MNAPRLAGCLITVFWNKLNIYADIRLKYMGEILCFSAATEEKDQWEIEYKQWNHVIGFSGRYFLVSKFKRQGREILLMENIPLILIFSLLLSLYTQNDCSAQTFSLSLSLSLPASRHFEFTWVKTNHIHQAWVVLNCGSASQLGPWLCSRRTPLKWGAPFVQNSCNIVPLYCQCTHRLQEPDNKSWSRIIGFARKLSNCHFCFWSSLISCCAK